MEKDLLEQAIMSKGLDCIKEVQNSNKASLDKVTSQNRNDTKKTAKSKREKPPTGYYKENCDSDIAKESNWRSRATLLETMRKEIGGYLGCVGLQ